MFLTGLCCRCNVQIGFKNQSNVPDPAPALTVDKVMTLVKDVFVSAAERDIYTGDGLHIELVSADGITSQSIQLRRD